MIYDRRNANRICVLALAGLLTVAFHAQAQTCSSSKEPNHGTCGDSCHEPGIFITIGKPTDTPVKPPQPKKPVIVPGGGGLYIIGKTDGTTPPKNPPPVNCDNDSVNNVVLYVYRDTPYWTLPMADWPEGENPRSPKFVFGKKRPISVEVHALLNTAEMEVDVTNLENREWLHITCKNAGRSKKHAGYYVYRHVESDVLNLAEETVKENEKKIKVIEEEILEFEVVGHPDTKVSYMVDRGECATATALNNDNNYNKALVDSSEYFWQQATAFGPLTTAWWNAGRALNSPNFGPFVRAVGNDGPSKEADVMLLGSHGSYRSALSSQGQVVFTPSGGGLRLKPDAKHAKDYNDQFKYPDEFYYDENAQYVREDKDGNNVASETFQAGDWDKDIDWAILVSCYQLSDKKLDTVTSTDGYVLSGKQVAPWQRWLPAFKGERRLHGLLGFSGTADFKRLSTTWDKFRGLRGMIGSWSQSLDQGQPIAKSWLEAGRSYGQPVAAVVIPRNFADTKDTMQPDPANGVEPVRLDTGLDERTLKKILGDGNYKAGQTLGDEAKEKGKETSWSLDCNLPDTRGRFPRLELVRSEQVKAGSRFTKDEEGAYRFARNLPMDLEANRLTAAEAEGKFRALLAQHFKNVPELATYGSFPRNACTATKSWQSGFSVLLEQRHRGLTLFNSEAYAFVTSKGEVDLARVLWYDVKERGDKAEILDARRAAELGAADFQKKHPGEACCVTNLLAYYGFPQTEGEKQIVRPIWAVEFNGGRQAHILDAVTGEVLDVRE